MGDVGERASVHQHRRALQGLRQVGLYRLLEQHRHGAGGLQVSGRHRRARAGAGDDDRGKPSFEVGEVGRKA